MIKKILSGTINGILAGICISLGGSVFLACDNKYVGAGLFCVALLTICYMGFSLYTGKIGLLINNHKKEDIIILFSGLVGNAIATAVFGLMLNPVFSLMSEKAVEMCNNKLEQSLIQTFIRGLMCGILMYIAVYVFAQKKTPIGILFCIPVFILSGFEHSIADMFYFATAKNFSVKAIIFIAVVVLGNSVGAWIIPILQKAKNKLDN